MQGTFFQTICRVGIFMICAQAVIHFRPDQSYEKYLKLLVSVMVLVQIFQPVGRFFLAGGRVEISDRIAWFQEQLDREMKQAAENSGRTGDLLEQMTLREVKERLAEQAVEGQVVENADADETAGAGNMEGSIPPVESVEPVKIE